MLIKSDHLFHYPSEFKLESGRKLPGFELKYSTLGQLNSEKNNVIWVCHALTGSSDFTDWWKGLFSEPSPFNPRDFLIICVNTLGGCYGSTGPLSLNPQTGRPYYHEFPLITNRDIVNAFDLLRQELGIGQIHTLIGGSMGGQQVLEWSILQPSVSRHLIAIACNAFHSPWGIAFNESQRMAIESDLTWKENDSRAGIEGMKAARAIAMISFRSYETFNETQSEKGTEKLTEYRAATYQRYQGQKIANRFNAFTYWTLTKAMDNHHLARGRDSLHSALRSVQAHTLVVGISSDLLFPVSEQQTLASLIPNAQVEILKSLYGHDGFLVEFDQLKVVIEKFYKTVLKEKEVLS